MKLDAAETAPLLAPLLDISLPQERAPTSAPDELRRRLAAVTASVMASARVQPVALAFEDLHWADPTTLDLLRGIAERGALAPLLVVATTRPEFRSPWGTRSHHATISLAPLDRAQVRDMIAELSARHALPREVVDNVAARTGGVPLFVEEVTRLLLERGDKGGIHVAPPSLQQSLMARLDRLGPAREVAQVGSIIARGFSYGLLRAPTGMADAALQAALEQLAEADILLIQSVPPDSDYRFKHALIQDAAYEGRQFNARSALRLNHAPQLKAEIVLLGLRHSPILRHRNLSERYHTQITELTATSIRATQTLTDAKHSNSDSLGVTPGLSTLPPPPARPPPSQSPALLRPWAPSARSATGNPRSRPPDPVVHALDQLADHARAVRRDDEDPGLPSKFVCAGAGPPLGFHVGHRAGLIQAVDAIGGDRGVDVQGVLGVQGVIEHRVAQLAEAPVHLCRHD